MTSLEHVFMLERSLHLTFQTMLAIYKSGQPLPPLLFPSCCACYVCGVSVSSTSPSRPC